MIVFDFKDEQSVHHCITVSWCQVAMVAKEIKAGDCATTEQRQIHVQVQQYHM